MYRKPDIYRCIRSSHDRLGFYAEIPIIFEPVHHISYCRCGGTLVLHKNANEAVPGLFPLSFTMICMGCSGVATWIAPKNILRLRIFTFPYIIYIFSTSGAVRGDIRVLFSGFFKTCSLTNREFYLPVVSGLKVRVKCERALPGTAQNPAERCSGLCRLNLAFPVKSRH